MSRMDGESLATRWGRRTITIPLYLALGAFALSLLPVFLLVAGAVDVASGRRQLVSLRCVLGLALYVVCEALGIVASFLLWAGSGVWTGASRERFVAWNDVLQSLWARALFHGARHIFSMSVEVSGSEETRQGPFFLFARHASVLDTLLPTVFASDPYRLSLRHVMKRELLWDPCLDIVGQRTRHAFIRRGSQERDREIGLLRQLAADMGDRDGILVFPEGTRFSRAKQQRALERLAASTSPERLERARSLRHVLPPRTGAVRALLETRPDVDVVFLAHSGLEGTTGLNELRSGQLVGRTIRLKFWRVAHDRIPRDKKGQVDWLDAQWARIDEWVSSHWMTE